ncbi:MAG TPA: RNA polymerase sigma factor [Streptosporangiaceae bacterium]
MQTRTSSPRRGTAPADTRGDDVADLVTAARQDDADAWSRLVELYSGMLLARIRFLGVGHDDARDVLQNTWLLAVQNLPRLRHAARIGSWLTTIATRESIRLSQRSKEVCTADPATVWRVACDGPGGGPPTGTPHGLPHGLTHGLRDGTGDAHRAWARTSFRRILDDVVGGLPADQRELFRALTEQPRPRYADVARRLGRPVGSIGPSRARCFGRVRMLLEDRGVTADFLD